MTCQEIPEAIDGFARRNFTPVAACAMPLGFPGRLTLPSVLDIFHECDRQQFEAIHVATPGPMGLCGLAVSKMLRAPLLCTHAMDYADIVERSTEEMRLSAAARFILRMLYSSAHTIFAARPQRDVLRRLGIADDRIADLTAHESPENFWAEHLRAMAIDRTAHRTPDLANELLAQSPASVV
jgi:hypothetical protein